MTLANLKQTGTTPFVKDRLNIVPNGFDTRYLNSFNILLVYYIGPHPVALGESSRLLRPQSLLMKLGLNKPTVILFGEHKDIEEVLADGIFEGELWPIFAKKSLKSSAVDLQLVNSALFLSFRR